MPVHLTEFAMIQLLINNEANSMSKKDSILPSAHGKTTFLSARRTKIPQQQWSTFNKLKYSKALNTRLSLSQQCPQDCTCYYSSHTSLLLQCKSLYKKAYLKSFFKGVSSQLKHLQFERSNLDTIPEELCILKKLTSLSLARNKISSISGGKFSCLHQLSEIVLDHSNIPYVDNTSFIMLHNLKSVSMKYCNINSLHPNAFILSELSRLQNIQMAHNSLTHMDMWPLKLSTMVEKHATVFLNVSMNKIETLINTIGIKITDLSNSDWLLVDFRRNRFHLLADMDLYDLLHVKYVYQLRNLWNMGFDFHFNPFVCDCAMYKILKILKSLIKLFSKFQDLYYIQLKCASPPSTKGKIIYEVPDDQFTCSVNESCPTKCACTHVPGNNTMVVNCNGAALENLPETVPMETNLELYMTGNNITTLNKQWYFTNVSILDVSSANVETVISDVFDDLANTRKIFLRRNKIKRLPKELYMVNFTKLADISLPKSFYM